MNNEPVAWGFFYDDGVIYDCVTNQDYFGENGIPLYTHPAKTLTDEEILEELLIPKSEWNSYKAYHCLKQIRAILRKAQEK